MKYIIIVALLWASVASASENITEICPQGEPIQWIADYCMAKIGTDDEIAASDCISKEVQLVFRDSCTAKLHFKRELCAVAIANSTRSGTIDSCVEDQTFIGSTVRNGGVGNGKDSGPAAQLLSLSRHNGEMT